MNTEIKSKENEAACCAPKNTSVETKTECCEQPDDDSSCCDKTKSKEKNSVKVGCC